MRNPNDVAYPVALHANQLVWATELAETATRPDNLSCVGCAGPVVLRAGQRNRAHFAHLDSQACTGGETALHATTIRVLRDAIAAAAADARPYPLALSCGPCLAERTGDLARHANGAIAVDQVLDEHIRPDLTISSGDGTPRVVIEVIVTHAPEAAALELYARRNIPAVLLWASWEILAELRSGLGPALLRTLDRTAGCFEVVDRCRFPRHRHGGPGRCQTCTKPTRPINAEVSTLACWKCKGDGVRVLDLYDYTDADAVLVAAGCPDLEQVPALAAKLGVATRWAHSKAAGGSYLMHLCGSCGAAQGDNFLYGPGSQCAPACETVTQFDVCEDGHWHQVAAGEWPPATTVGRPKVTVGLVGEPAHLFEALDTHNRPGVQFTTVTADNIGAIARRMTGADRI